MLRPEVSTARKLRREMSLPEVLLWRALRGEKTGIKFRRQHPVGPYVVDFYCRATSLIVELDGEAHERGDRPQRDVLRDRFLKENGYRVTRVNAAEVLRDWTRSLPRSSPLRHSPTTMLRMVPLPVPGRNSLDFISILSIFVLACFVGYYVVWSVTPALHTPLMAVTNAISSVIIVGALIASAASGAEVAKWLGLVAVALASVNIFGGFAVTERMLAMYKKKG
jgi:H+-translocating NAD(P) transhydrogenase subunit alpha